MIACDLGLAEDGRRSQPGLDAQHLNAATVCAGFVTLDFHAVEFQMTVTVSDGAARTQDVPACEGQVRKDQSCLRVDVKDPVHFRGVDDRASCTQAHEMERIRGGRHVQITGSVPVFSLTLERQPVGTLGEHDDIVLVVAVGDADRIAQTTGGTIGYGGPSFESRQ